MFSLSSLRHGRRLATATTGAVKSACATNGQKCNFATETQSPLAAQTFIDNVISVCPDDDTWGYYRKPDIDSNTVVFETYFGQSCMLTPINYDVLHAKHSQYQANTEIDTKKQYTKAATTILNERLNEVINDEDNDIKRIVVGGINKETKDTIVTDAKYSNANQTLTMTNRFVLYKENLSQFESAMNLSELQEKVIDMNFDEVINSNFEDTSLIRDEFMIEEIRSSGYQFIMKSLNANDLSNVVSLNHYGNFGLSYSNEFDFYVENCLSYGHLPHYGIYTVLPPSSIFGPRLKLVGCAFVHCANLSIGGIAVDPKFRQKGFASALVYQCAKKMFDNGFEMVYAHFRNENDEARNLFTKLAWEKLDDAYYWLTLGFDASPTVD